MRKPRQIIYILPCPVCGSCMLAKGRSFTRSTPWIFRLLFGRLGVSCTMCGHQALTVNRWNKEERKGLLTSLENISRHRFMSYSTRKALHYAIWKIRELEEQNKYLFERQAEVGNIHDGKEENHA